CDGLKPKCFWCITKNADCQYVEERPKKRKHDADYIVGLETQVELLREELFRLKNPGSDPKTNLTSDVSIGFDVSDSANVPSLPQELPLPQDGSTAISDVSSLMWRLTIDDGGGTTLVGPSGNFCFPVTQHQSPNDDRGVTIPKDAAIHRQPWISEHATTKNIHQLINTFFQFINPVQQFISNDMFTVIVGASSPPLNFLRCAVLAAGALFSDDSESKALGLDAASYVEAEALGISRQYLCPEIVQGLSIMCWRELWLDNGNMVWMYNSMAASLALHLGLTVSSLKNLSEDSVGGKNNAKTPESISLRLRALWAALFLDRITTSLLGRNCVTPSHRVKVPAFLEVARSLPSLDEIVFDHHCRLWFLHDQHMELIYSFDFDAIDGTKRLQMLIEAREQLFSFYRSLEEPLQFHKAKSPPTVIFLHMSYNMSQMLIHRPYLNEPPQSNAHRLSIRSIATAASAMVRLIRAYEKIQSLDKVPPFVVHSIHTAAITLLLTATSTSPAIRSQSINRFRVCLLALEAMRMRWPRAKQAVLSLQQLAQRWRIAIALPMRSSNPL
ncbi:hypothetical protein BGZ61DRAFT_307278, partial [Ilyonectria robusta]|uniref:uncharacterized protein n=1 Tax=Ilyonectria robusta TaxID=1079257 RepID=UPI001E8DE0DF